MCSLCISSANESNIMRSYKLPQPMTQYTTHVDSNSVLDGTTANNDHAVAAVTAAVTVAVTAVVAAGGIALR